MKFSKQMLTIVILFMASAHGETKTPKLDQPSMAQTAKQGKVGKAFSQVKAPKHPLTHDKAGNPKSNPNLEKPAMAQAAHQAKTGKAFHKATGKFKQSAQIGKTGKAGNLNAQTCQNDLSTADSYGDDCNDYDSYPQWCGGYDTADFDSATQCCICAGTVTEGTQYDGCQNDLSSADSYGDDCNDYDSYPQWCGGYDTADFDSATQCCICGGTGTDDAPVTEGTQNDGCENDLSTADVDGDDCNQYDSNPGWCGGYDTADFDSATQCCVCGGADASVAPSDGCENDLSTADSYGDDCDAYDYNPGWCGGYDTSDFNSAAQCCICSGSSAYQGLGTAKSSTHASPKTHDKAAKQSKHTATAKAKGKAPMREATKAKGKAQMKVATKAKGKAQMREATKAKGKATKEGKQYAKAPVTKSTKKAQKTPHGLAQTKSKAKTSKAFGETIALFGKALIEKEAPKHDL